MPKHIETPCDGCSVVGGDLIRNVMLNGDAHTYCPDCLRRRVEDPPITYRGRSLPLSEFKRQAKDDPDLKASLEGDTVQEQIAAATKQLKGMISR